VIKEKSQYLPLAETSCKPTIVAFTAHKPIHASQSWNDITRANLRHLLKRLSPDPATAQSLSGPQDTNLPSHPAAKGTHPKVQLYGTHTHIPVSASPLSAPQRQSLDIPLLISDGYRTSLSSSCPPTAAQPLVSEQASHTMKSQVARTGRSPVKSSQGIQSEDMMAHAGMKRKRENSGTVDHPAKVTRMDDKPVSCISYAPEALNTGPQDQQKSVHPLPPLSKFAVYHWANHIDSAAYLRDMGKPNGKVYNSLIDTLSAIKAYQDHRELTPSLLKETNLAVQLQKFVDQSSNSPESRLATEICTHWRSTFGDKL
jgi:hypothetical protein